MRLGLMGGTFDPIHYGHLVIAETARVEFCLEQVIFIPAATPPHKVDRSVSDAEQRYAMLVAATASNPHFFTSRLEMERNGPSYTVDTLRQFRAQGGPDQELFFITGADSILEILTWRHHEEVIRLATFIAVTRPGYDLGRLERVLPASYLPQVRVLRAPLVDVSSTDLRKRVRRDQPIRYLVPESVEVYINKHGLYRAGAEPLPPAVQEG